MWAQAQSKEETVKRMVFKTGNVPWIKGKHHTEETRRKLSEARIGKIPWIAGKHHTEATKQKISEKKVGCVGWTHGLTKETDTRILAISLRHTGWHHTVESKEKISGATKGRPSWIKGKHHSDETRERLSKTNKGKHHSFETRKKMSENRRGSNNSFYGKRHTIELKRKLSELRKGKHYPKLSEAKKGKHYPKLSEAHTRAMKEGKYNLKPTQPEKKFTEICAKYNLPFKYVGDGKFWIENVNPDFVESNGRKMVVEIYGDYWHNRLDNIERDKHRVTILKKYGWKLLVLWEHEINKLPDIELVNKVMELENGSTKS